MIQNENDVEEEVNTMSRPVKKKTRSTTTTSTSNHRGARARAKAKKTKEEKAKQEAEEAEANKKKLVALDIALPQGAFQGVIQNMMENDTSLYFGPHRTSQLQSCAMFHSLLYYGGERGAFLVHFPSLQDMTLPHVGTELWAIQTLKWQTIRQLDYDRMEHSNGTATLRSGLSERDYDSLTTYDIQKEYCILFLCPNPQNGRYMSRVERRPRVAWDDCHFWAYFVRHVHICHVCYPLHDQSKFESFLKQPEHVRAAHLASLTKCEGCGVVFSCDEMDDRHTFARLAHDRRCQGIREYIQEFPEEFQAREEEEETEAEREKEVKEEKNTSSSSWLCRSHELVSAKDKEWMTSDEILQAQTRIVVRIEMDDILGASARYLPDTDTDQPTEPIVVYQEDEKHVSPPPTKEEVARRQFREFLILHPDKNQEYLARELKMELRKDSERMTHLQELFHAMFLAQTEASSKRTRTPKKKARPTAAPSTTSTTLVHNELEQMFHRVSTSFVHSIPSLLPSPPKPARGAFKRQ